MAPMCKLTKNAGVKSQLVRTEKRQIKLLIIKKKTNRTKEKMLLIKHLPSCLKIETQQQLLLQKNIRETSIFSRIHEEEALMSGF